jgi:hypothetical protein
VFYLRPFDRKSLFENDLWKLKSSKFTYKLAAIGNLLTLWPFNFFILTIWPEYFWWSILEFDLKTIPVTSLSLILLRPNWQLCNFCHSERRTRKVFFFSRDKLRLRSVFLRIVLQNWVHIFHWSTIRSGDCDCLLAINFC